VSARTTAPRGKKRLDVLLVERGLVESRQHAQAAILAGEVMIGGRPGSKPGQLVEGDAEVSLRRRKAPYVSRGGYKLEHALAVFGLSVAGKVALDVGSSTGGFTDCLLQRGAARVYAVDVGRGQLHWRLREDKRVIVHEQTHAANLDESVVPEPVDLATVDVSFISLTRVLPAVSARVRQGGSIIALVKPQFEVGRGAGKALAGGVVRSPDVHREVLRRVAAAAGHGLVLAGLTHSPLAGPKGNREFFFWLVKGDAPPVDDLDARIAAVVADAHAAPEDA
jgi:23S rRNA (cytidine1920-2'-O)/16S rRNA (cytidine1409-2'-O)-methyltransferase